MLSNWNFFFRARVALQIDQLQLNRILCLFIVCCKWWCHDIKLRSKSLVKILISEYLTPDTLWSAFCEVLNSAIEQFVPIQHVHNTHRSVIKYYTHNIKSAIVHKRCLWRQLRNDKHNNVLRHTYKQAGAKCRLLIHKYELKNEKKIVHDNTGSYYKFIYEKLSCKRGVGALRDNTGSPVTDDSTQATLLNNFFGSVCTRTIVRSHHLLPETEMLLRLALYSSLLK